MKPPAPTDPNNQLPPKALKPTTTSLPYSPKIPAALIEVEAPTESTEEAGLQSSKSLENLLSSTSNSSLTTTTTRSPAGYKILKNGSNEPFSLTLFSPMSAQSLAALFLQTRDALCFARFKAGLHPDPQRMDVHDPINLRRLKKITLELPKESLERKKGALPPQLTHLLHLLKQINFTQLDSIRVICGEMDAIRLPLSSAFINSYDPEETHPLIDLIRRNQKTLRTLVIGPTLGELLIKLSKSQGPVDSSTKEYAKIEIFSGFQEIPLLPSCSAMLRAQSSLRKLSLTLFDEEVWKDVCEGIRASAESLHSFLLNLIPIEGVSVIVDLKALYCCKVLKEFGIKFIGCNVIGWGFLPKTISTFSFFGGPLSSPNTELLSGALSNLEEVNVFLIPPSELRMAGSVGVEKNPIVPIRILDITQHPTYQFVKAGPRSLRTFNVECETGIELDWDSLSSALSSQTDWRISEISKSERKGDLRLEKEAQEENVVEKEVRFSFLPCFDTLGDD